MTSTRIIDDFEVAQYKDFLVKNSHDYVMNKNSVENFNTCNYKGGGKNSVTELSKPRNSDGSLDIPRQVTIEHLLQNRHLEPDSFERLNDNYNQVAIENPLACSRNTVKEHLILEDTRLTYPAHELREQRYENYNFIPYLPVNPQDVLNDTTNWFEHDRKGIFEPEARNGTSTRITLKGTKYRNNPEGMNGFKSMANALLPF